MAATLFFLQFKDGKGKLITGESTASGYQGQIELEGFSWGSSAEHSPRQDNKVSTQVQYEHLTFTKFYDRASPGLSQGMLGSGGAAAPLPFQSALISVVDMVLSKDKTTGVPVVEIKLEDGFIEDVKLAVSDSGNAMQVKETVTLSYRLVKLTYFQGTQDRASRGSGFYFEGEAASLDN